MILDDDTGRSRPESAGLFPATHWSVVLRAKEESTTALNTLFTKYRQPMIVLLKGKTFGFDQHRAEDLVHGFCEKLIKKGNFLADYKKQGAKFRTFLSTSLINFVRDELRRERIQKHGGGAIPDSLDALNADGKPVVIPAASTLSADLEYDKVWIQTIIDDALYQLEKEFAGSRKLKLFQALVQAMYKDKNSPAYKEIAKRFNMTEAAVKQRVFDLKQRFGQLIRKELMQTISNVAQFEEEKAYLMSLFSPP